MTNPIPLPHAYQSDFAEQVRELSNKHQIAPPMMKSILEDDQADPEDRFTALYFLLHRLEREYKYSEYAELCHKYEFAFGSRPYFQTFRATIARRLGSGTNALHSALRASKRAVADLSDRPGVLHQYAGIVAELSERDENVRAEELDSALAAVERAIDQSPIKNASFHATKARLLRATKDYSAAEHEIDLATSLEATTGEDAARRLSRLESIRTEIRLAQRHEQLQKLVSSTEDSLKFFRNEQLQQLGVLAAVIALLTAGINFAAHADLKYGMRMMLLSSGAISVAFCVLIGALSHVRWRRVMFGLVIGSALIATGLVVTPT